MRRRRSSRELTSSPNRDFFFGLVERDRDRGGGEDVDGSCAIPVMMSSWMRVAVVSCESANVSVSLGCSAELWHPLVRGTLADVLQTSAW
ncbi:unnamed protein product [Cylicostephanus goldi]|uniref:Uncharacterized protein n=1 Tax=Cylicostephanus goldi TaxID=71465 RepID=A0A3P6QC45_CYLGO|nr:unnamed protein product [Cylicostephanus goldi]